MEYKIPDGSIFAQSEFAMIYMYMLCIKAIALIAKKGISEFSILNDIVKHIHICIGGLD